MTIKPREEWPINETKLERRLRREICCGCFSIEVGFSALAVTEIVLACLTLNYAIYMSIMSREFHETFIVPISLGIVAIS